MSLAYDTNLSNNRKGVHQLFLTYTNVLFRSVTVMLVKISILLGLHIENVKKEIVNLGDGFN